MGPDMVIVGSPTLDGCSCVRQAGEPMQVQAVFTELAIEAFDEGILGGTRLHVRLPPAN